MNVRNYLLASVMSLCVVVTSTAQDVRTPLRLELDDKPVKAKFSVRLKTSGKVYDLRTDAASFYLPEDVNLDEWVSITIEFKKYMLEFDSIHRSIFGADWAVGVDRPPYSLERLEETQPKDVLSLYYLQFCAEPCRNLTVKIAKKTP